MCGALGVRPKQAAGLLTQNHRHLATVMRGGIHGSFAQVIGWLDAVRAKARETNRTFPSNLTFPSSFTSSF